MTLNEWDLIQADLGHYMNTTRDTLGLSILTKLVKVISNLLKENNQLKQTLQDIARVN
jgi:hypothetical protein